MKKIVYLALTIVQVLGINAQALGCEFAKRYTKHQLINTEERMITAVDVENLIAYCMHDGVISAYDIERDEKLFDLKADWSSIEKFGKDGRAVVIDKENRVAGFVDKTGKMVTEVDGSYRYVCEYKTGLVCLEEMNKSENKYTIINRRGKAVAQGFYLPECELSDGSIIIMDETGKHSRIDAEGKIKPFNCRKLIRIEDSVSLNGKVYVGEDGNIYTLDGQKLYENKDYDMLFPVNQKWALATDDGKAYVVNLKSDKSKILQPEGNYGEYMYTDGSVSDGKVFVSGGLGSALVDLEEGKVISGTVVNHTPFYCGISSVSVQEGEKTEYHYMKNNGKYLSETGYEYATDMENGYGVAVKKKGGTAEICSVLANGEETLLHAFPGFGKVIELGDKKLVAESLVRGNMQNISLVKGSKGNLYIGPINGESTLYEKNKGIDFASKIIFSLLAAGAIAVIVLLAMCAKSE